MITYILHIVLPLVLICLSMGCYKSAAKRMVLFYTRMAFHHSCRKFYTLMTLLVLLLFHFNYANMVHCVYDLAPSSIAFIFLFSHRLFERVIYFLQEKKAFFTGAIIAMTCLLVPHFFSTGFTFGVLLFSAVFYPSKSLIEQVSQTDYRKRILKEPAKIVCLYYNWDDRC